MPWKESPLMEERLRFAARLEISGRGKEHGLEALSGRSRRPVRYANRNQICCRGIAVYLRRDLIAA